MLRISYTVCIIRINTITGLMFCHNCATVYNNRSLCIYVGCRIITQSDRGTLHTGRLYFATVDGDITTIVISADTWS